MVLRDCGWLSITPTVERPFGLLPIFRAATISSAAPTWPLPTCWDGDLNSHQAFEEGQLLALGHQLQRHIH